MSSACSDLILALGPQRFMCRLGTLLLQALQRSECRDKISLYRKRKVVFPDDDEGVCGCVTVPTVPIIVERIMYGRDQM
jgi:hypothetical protein